MADGRLSASKTGRISVKRGLARRSLAVILGILMVLASLPLTAGVAGATPNQPTWTQLSPGTSPSGRSNSSMVFDPATGQLLLFGGSDNSSYFDETWSWNGSTWTHLNPATSPPGRSGASMGFDPATGQMILFGGESDNGTLNDTWSWNGTDWTKLSPSNSPLPRTNAGMAFDPGTGQFLLFGGGGGGFFNDTWNWTGTNWIQLSPSTSPSKRVGPSLAYDPATGQMILFGGESGSSLLNDTWRWNGTTWTQLSPGTSPSTRYDATMAFDPVAGILVLFGGYGFNGAHDQPLNDTWIWNGTTWTNLDPATRPSNRWMASMAFDPATGQLILFGGFFGTPLNDSWVYGVPSFGVNWTQLSPATSPSARERASSAFDPATGQLILFGGFDGTSYLNDTFTWDGSTWAQQSPVTSPAVRYSASMAFDPATGQLLLFGGQNAGGYFGDTWIWTGSTWTQLMPAASPPERSGAGMTFDPATGQMILFGGHNGISGYLNDTWAWDGTAWTQLSPATSPPVRISPSLAFDPAAGQLLLFGGSNTSSYFADTWTWTGSTWTQLSPATSPPVRDGANLAFDPVTGQMILFGGLSSGFLNDTWSWTGATWTQLTPATSPPARYNASLVFDPATGQFILFGGTGANFNVNNDTWALSPVLDTTAPTTTATGANADTTAYTFGNWTNQTVTVTLSASDMQSGVAATYYTIDSGTQQTYSAPFDVSGSGTHTITYWSVDKVGNVETVNSATVMIETVAPSTTASATNADTTTYTFGTWTNQAVTVTLSASDSGGASVAGTFYTIDSGTQQTYSTPFAISSEGDHIVTYWSTDTAGNMETVNTVHVMIDTTAPVVTYSGNPGTYSVDQTVNITCAATDTLSGIASTTCQDISGPAYSFAMGLNTFTTSATDNAGNVGTGSTSFTVTESTTSLCALTKQFETNRVTAGLLCLSLNGISAVPSPSVKSFFINIYDIQVILDRTLTTQQKKILIGLARGL